MQILENYLLFSSKNSSEIQVFSKICKLIIFIVQNSPRRQASIIRIGERILWINSTFFYEKK
jgi:hypothetical protein